jgi:hypothetical protein
MGEPRAAGRPPSGRTDALPRVRVRPDSRAAFEAAAKARGISVSQAQREAYADWVRKHQAT